MKKDNKLNYVFNYLWIIISVIIAIFFMTALIVYATATPKSVTEVLKRDGSWLGLNELTASSGDLEQYPYVTKADELEISAERLEIIYNKKSDDMDYGVLEDPSLNVGFKVEFFVFSDIADKELVKRLWNITQSISGDDAKKSIILNLNDEFNIPYVRTYTDIKKQDADSIWYFRTFVRITAKNGAHNVAFLNVNTDADNTNSL